jgi:hypothetical protein
MTSLMCRSRTTDDLYRVLLILFLAVGDEFNIGYLRLGTIWRGEGSAGRQWRLVMMRGYRVVHMTGLMNIVSIQCALRGKSLKMRGGSGEMFSMSRAFVIRQRVRIRTGLRISECRMCGCHICRHRMCRVNVCYGGIVGGTLISWFSTSRVEIQMRRTVFLVFFGFTAGRSRLSEGEGRFPWTRSSGLGAIGRERSIRGAGASNTPGETGAAGGVSWPRVWAAFPFVFFRPVMDGTTKKR